MTLILVPHRHRWRFVLIATGETTATFENSAENCALNVFWTLRVMTDCYGFSGFPGFTNHQTKFNEDLQISNISMGSNEMRSIQPSINI